MPPTSRQDKRHQETRDEILDAARALVVEKGAHALTVRELAARVDLTAPALYRYFADGKDEILLALAAQDLDHLSAHLLTVPDRAAGRRAPHRAGTGVHPVRARASGRA